MVEAILDGAFDLMAKGRPEDDVSVQEVADRAGVGVSSLYDYFRDRGSILSAAAAKITEDNRIAFEKVLAETASVPRREGVKLLVDHCFAHFLTGERSSRLVLRIAHRIGMMPTVAASTNVAVDALADALRKRTDVRVRDPDLAAWTMTHTMLGVIHTLIWQEEPRFSEEVLRDEMVDLFDDYLSGKKRDQVV
jgi:AcrR family transcriptional regulator